MENEKPSTRRPVWIPVVQAAQFLLALIILGLSAYLIHGIYFDTLGYDIFCCILTWIVVVFLIASTYISSLSALNHIVIVIGSNALMVLFWLAAMGATARLRSTFKYNVSIYGCYDDGSSVDSTTCLVGRALQARAAVATHLGLSIMSAIAGLSALVMLLFVAVLVHSVLTWFKGRSSTTIVAQAPQKQEEGYPMATAQPQQPQYAPVQQQQQQQQQQYAPPQQVSPLSFDHQQVYAQQQNSTPTQGQAMPGPPSGHQTELPASGH